MHVYKTIPENIPKDKVKIIRLIKSIKKKGVIVY